MLRKSVSPKRSRRWDTFRARAVANNATSVAANKVTPGKSRIDASFASLRVRVPTGIVQIADETGGYDVDRQ